MDSGSFWRLLCISKPLLQGERKENGGGGGANWLVDSEMRLSATLRCFAGGRPDDICLVHGTSHTEAHDSVWKVVDAMLNSDKLFIGYPTKHDKQKEIAKGFQGKSHAGFATCICAIDGMMMWTEKPHARDCGNLEVGAKKFFCGRKKKHGLNLRWQQNDSGHLCSATLTFACSETLRMWQPHTWQLILRVFEAVRRMTATSTTRK